MTKTLVLLGLMFGGMQSGKHFTELAIPTKIAAAPAVFGKGQMVSLSATFKQPQTACPVFLKDRAEGFAIRLYDEKDVYGEPIWTLDVSKSNKAFATTGATTGLNDADDLKRVQRTFDSLQLRTDAPGRFYAAVFRTCSGKILKVPGDPSIYEPYWTAPLVGGQFYKFSCPGNGKIPTGKCGYRPE